MTRQPYALKPSTGDPWSDYFALYIASNFKQYYDGTYYIPRLRLYAPVFRLPPWNVDRRVFVPLREEDLEDAYRMICIRCGLCCARNAGAFAFEHEIRTIRDKIPLDESKIRVEYVYIRELGRLPIYFLDTGPGGRCIFYSPMRGCTLDDELKPIICVIHYCSLFAERRGERYVKVTVKEIDGKPVPIYRKISEEQLEIIRRRLTNKARDLARRAARSVRERGERSA